VFAAFDKDLSVEDVLLGEYVIFDTSKSDTVIKDAVFVLPKTYGVVLGDGEEVVKIKGVNTDLVSYNRLKEAFYNKNEYVVTSTSFFNLDGIRLNQFVQDKNIKMQSYDKRIWSEDLKSTGPVE
jgi:hypothetical protein